MRASLPLQTLPLDAVRWTRGFWAERFEVLRRRMVPALWSLMEGTSPSHYYENFRIAAGLAEGRHRGAPFNDGDFYKWLEAASALLAVAPDAELEQRIEEVAGVIARAQRGDGYLHTPVLIRQRSGDEGARPLQDPLQFEMYNMGHLLTAACVHHRVTGRTSLLAIARKAADFLGAAFDRPTPELARHGVCPSHLMGLVELSRVTGERRTLELARKLLEMRALVADGGDDNQDRLPFHAQTEAAGHAVRANYLYAGAADLFLETGDASLWQTLERLWESVVRTKLSITGGCGALYDGASPDGAKEQGSIRRVHQAYGRSYQLPNTTAHNETCAAIGSVLWNWRMFRATGEARFLDVLEVTLYNSVLSGMSLAGTEYLYVNPLRVTDPLPAPLRWSRTRVPYVSSFCCPPNLARTLAQLHGYAYARSADALWVNLYGGSTLETELAGRPLKLTQETEYPWSGRVRLTVDGGGAAFALKLRIPGWAGGATLRVNGRPAEPSPAPGTYAELRREWQAGDVVELDLPMRPRRIEAHPLVEETRNQVALQRGPLVYCLESPDLPPGRRVLEISLPAAIALMARYERHLLGGVVLLEGEALARPSGDWEGRLYRDYAPPEAERVPARFIPYFAWGNRGPSEMTVWLPLAVDPGG